MDAPQIGLLALQLLGELRRNRQHRLALGLDVQVAQIGMPIRADVQGAAGERDDARDPEARVGQKQNYRAVLLVLEQLQVGLVHPLPEDVALHLLRQPVVDPGDLRAVDLRAMMQPGQSVLGLLVQEPAQRDHPALPRRRRPRRAVTNPEQIVLQDLPRKQARAADLRGVLGQPGAEVPQVGQVVAHRPRRGVAEQPGAGPAPGGLLQPRLPDRPEVQIDSPAIHRRQIAVGELVLRPGLLGPERLPAARGAAAIQDPERLGGAHQTRSATFSRTPRLASAARRSSAVGWV